MMQAISKKRCLCQMFTKFLPHGLALMLLIGGLAATEPPASFAQEAQNGPGWQMWSPGSKWRQEWRQNKMSPRHQRRMQRHWLFMNGSIPKGYQGLSSPVGENDAIIAAGQQVYTKHCAGCHGDEGLGSGEAGFDLHPSPALLAFMVHAPIAADSYLMWTIAEGGKDLNSGMPAYKETLSKKEIWQVIAYIRNGFALP